MPQIDFKRDWMTLILFCGVIYVAELTDPADTLTTIARMWGVVGYWMLLDILYILVRKWWNG